MAELVYDFAFQSLLRGVGVRTVERVRPELVALGVDPERLRASYERQTWERTVELLSTTVDGETRAERHRRLGELVTRGFSATTLGRVLTPAVRLIGVSRMMQRAPRNFEVTNNFTKARLVSVDGAGAQLELNHASPSPEFLCGSLAEMGRYAGAKQIEVSFVVEPDGRTQLRARY
ncbi:MAG: DUF2378 family protein [Myxococcota bacterium]